MSKFSNDGEIRELIHLYKEHECLWNIHCADYKDKPLKQKAWLEIANFFNKTPNEVKRKMQYLRAAYVHEKRRVDASKKSDTKTVHKPSLFYYKEMDFLDNMVIWRKFNDGKDACNIYSESIGNSQDFEIKEFMANNEDDYIQEPMLDFKIESCGESDFDPVRSTPVSCTELPSSTIIKKNYNIKPKANKPSLTSNDTERQKKLLYDSFGKTIAFQLQQLPLEDALLAMSEIQNIITMKRLEHIRNIQNDYDSDSQSEAEETYNEF